MTPLIQALIASTANLAAQPQSLIKRRIAGAQRNRGAVLARGGRDTPAGLCIEQLAALAQPPVLRAVAVTARLERDRVVAANGHALVICESSQRLIGIKPKHLTIGFIAFAS